MASIAAFYGVTSSSVSPYVLLLALPIVGTSLYLTFPKGLITLEGAMNKALAIHQVEQIVPQPDHHVGLVGITATGKTSFRGQLANRTEVSSTQTNLVELIALPGPAKNTIVALYDSVGQNFYAMFQIARIVKTLIVFVDHSESAENGSVRSTRLAAHKTFVTQLCRVLEEIDTSRRPDVWVVATKFDLLQGDARSRQRIAGLRERLRTQIGKIVGDAKVSAYGDYSNRTAGDAVLLLRQVVHAE